MTYQVNPDGTVTIIRSVKEAQENANNWKDYPKDLGKKENS